MHIQLNPHPWPQCLGTEVTTVVMRPFLSASLTKNHDHQTIITDQMLLARQPVNERLAMQHAIPARQTEFTRGRYCLRQALKQIGHLTEHIPIGQSRQPILPTGTIGSISHCDDYVAAACAPQVGLLGVGIDVEKNQPLTADIQHLILTVAEQDAIKKLYACEQLSIQTVRSVLQKCYWETVFFSIKESFYKAMFTVHPYYVDFLQAEVQILDSSTFTIHPLISLSKIGQRKHTGHYALDDHYIYSGICITQN